MVIKNLDIDTLNLKRILKKYQTIKIKNYVISNYLVDKYRLYDTKTEEVFFSNSIEIIMNRIKRDIDRQLRFKVGD